MAHGLDFSLNFLTVLQRTETVEKTRLSFTFGSCHSEAEQKTMSKAINLLFTEPINCAKNPIFRFEVVAVVLCWNSVAVDNYFIYSVLEADFCKLLKYLNTT